ncbi:putative phage abortive infection protein [Denitromonas ohlonensis]|uniref:Phage abortive infection protein n=2 Tax=Denitromonas TaxID=139331 RepID=A0A557RLE9_9RHOO|nr:putative phage abortive infection protein [Denitromonas ohlonensis]TVO65942.1 hypothetical protein FHP90_10750 [Denitromonas ohlonensis]TVO79535.1 hypothetical protein FHP89_01935 [Denitromonas ohlonensis]
MMSETGESAERSIIEHESKLPGLLAGILLVAAVLAVLAVGFYVLRFYDAPISGDPAAWGQLGDYLGGVLNPAFSFFALLGLLMTLAMQAKELRLSREVAKASQKALELSQIEMANSARALEQQNRAIDRQRFEQTFFAWLLHSRALFDSAKEKMNLDLEVIRLVKEANIQQWFRKENPNEPPVFQPREGLASEQAKSYERDFKVWFAYASRYQSAHTGLFGPALRSLSELFVWLGETDGENLDAARYVRIVLSQLSEYELLALFISYQLAVVSLTEHEVENYQIFRNLDPDRYPALDTIANSGRLTWG